MAVCASCPARPRWVRTAPQATVSRRISRIACNTKARIEATLEPAGLEVGELAGLALFQNETHHVVAAVERSDAGAALVLRLRNGKDDPLPGRELKRVPLASNDAALSLRLQLDDQHLDVSWRSGTEHWNTLLNRLDASLLSVDHAGGFIGNTFGPYAVHQ